MRTCDGIVAASTHGINRTDVFGTTALDSARSKKQAAVEAIILAKGGLSGDDPSLQNEHEEVREFVESNAKSLMSQRRRKVTEELPEFKLRVTVRCVAAALQNFMEVRAEMGLLSRSPLLASTLLRPSASSEPCHACSAVS